MYDYQDTQNDDSTKRFSFSKVFNSKWTDAATAVANTANLDRYVRQPDDIHVSYLQWLFAGDSERQSLYKIYREYYEGDHPTQLTDRMQKFLELKSGVDFHLNYITIPVDVLVERLAVIGFGAGAFGGIFTHEEDENKPLVKYWNANRLDAIQNSVHLCMVRDGDAYVLVEWNEEKQRPAVSLEMAYDGDQGVEVMYSEERRGVIDYAVKRWRTRNGRQRANVYYADRIEKYISTKAGGWGKWYDSEEDAAADNWPLAWTDSNGEPLGVPIIHFAYNAGGYDFGKSRLHDLIPLQDALNKSAIDELATMDVEAFRLITLTGDDPGELTIAPGQLLYAENPDARWGHIPSGELEKVMKVVNNWVIRISQMSRIPLAYFQITGQVASYETQKADDAGLVSLARSTAIPTGNSWEDVMSMALRLDMEFGNLPRAELPNITAIWDSFESIDALDRAKSQSEIVRNLTQSGASLDGAAFAAGYNDEERERLIRTDLVDGIEQ